MIAIEVIEHCNFKCFFCKAKDLTQHKYMDVALFERIILEAKELGYTSVSLTPSTGEPFLHPKIYQILSFAGQHMKEVTLHSNATAINVSELCKVDMHNMRLSISKYGRDLAEFTALTGMGEHLFNKFNERLVEMTAAGINYDVGLRTIDYDYNFEDTAGKFATHDPKIKCRYHSLPKIFVNGDVTFCKFFNDNVPNKPLAMFANVTNSPLKDALVHPIRYKFFDSQSICISECNSSNTHCGRSTFNSFKLLHESKLNYIKHKEQTDAYYTDLERQCIQPSKP